MNGLSGHQWSRVAFSIRRPLAYADPRHPVKRQSPGRSWMLLLAVALALAPLGACGGPRGEPVSRQQALAWHDVLTVRVVAVQDLLRRHADADPHISHLVTVRILNGPAQHVGRLYALPYDAYATGGADQPWRRPPYVGHELTLMPWQWVAPERGGRRRR